MASLRNMCITKCLFHPTDPRKTSQTEGTHKLKWNSCIRLQNTFTEEEGRRQQIPSRCFSKLSHHTPDKCTQSHSMDNRPRLVIRGKCYIPKLKHIIQYSSGFFAFESKKEGKELNFENSGLLSIPFQTHRSHNYQHWRNNYQLLRSKNFQSHDLSFLTLEEYSLLKQSCSCAWRFSLVYFLENYSLLSETS